MPKTKKFEGNIKTLLDLKKAHPIGCTFHFHNGAKGFQEFLEAHRKKMSGVGSCRGCGPLPFKGDQEENTEADSDEEEKDEKYMLVVKPNKRGGNGKDLIVIYQTE